MQTKTNKKTYKKPKVVATNAPTGGYAAGCPARDSYMCTSCFRK